MNDIDIPQMTEAELAERLNRYDEIKAGETELYAYHLMHRDLGAEQDTELQLASDINELDDDDPDYERKEEDLKSAFARLYPYQDVQMRDEETCIKWLEDSEPKRRLSEGTHRRGPF